MVEPFKNLLDAGAVERLAGHVRRADAAFPARDFLADVAPGLAPLALMDRVRHVAAGLARHLPADFERAAATLVAALGPEAGEDGFEGEHPDGVRGMPVLALTRFVADQGLDAFEPALAALNAMTRRFSAEFDVRPFLERHPAATWARLHTWAADPNPHVRRLCSEGTRARLPWGKRVAALLADPEPGLALVARLRDDASLYVRRSVANHLNDASKDHPDRVLALARAWLDGASADRAWIVRHALRTRLKAADPAALALFAYPALPLEVPTFTVAPAVAFTGRLPYTLELVAGADGPALIDEIVHYVKARGGRSPKVFRVADRQMVAGEVVRYDRAIDFKPITTRRHYPGAHRLEIRVNGRVVAGADFTLEAPLMAVTLITGASSGLGYGLAPYMAADGDTVILTARRLESLQQLAEKIREKGGKAVPVALDVTDPAAVRAAVAAIERDHGPVDTLIANAGIGADTSALRWRSEDLERIYRTNVFGVSHCIEAVLPGMIARRQGHLVAVASLAGYRGLPASGAYASSKAAVISLMESLRVELRGHGVRVTTLSPGFVKTELTAKNRFPMPFLMELDDAARLMHRAIRRQKSEYRFPWTLASVITLARFLPNRLWDYLLRNRKVIKAE